VSNWGRRPRCVSRRPRRPDRGNHQAGGRSRRPIQCCSDHPCSHHGKWNWASASAVVRPYPLCGAAAPCSSEQSPTVVAARMGAWLLPTASVIITARAEDPMSGRLALCR